MPQNACDWRVNFLKVRIISNNIGYSGFLYKVRRLLLTFKKVKYVKIITDKISQ